MDAWILLRGLGRESEHWGQFVQQVQKQFVNTKIICLDWPGLGTYHQQSLPLCPHQCIASLKHQLENAYPKNMRPQNTQIGIIGMSLGGALALLWSQTKPQLFSKIVCINSSLAQLSFFGKRLQLNALIKLLSIMPMPIHYREKEIFYLTTKIFHPNSQHIIKQWAELAKKHPLSVQNFFRQLIVAMRINITDYQGPSPLLLASRHDRLVHWHTSKQLSTFFDVPLFINEQAGHDLTLDDPKWCLKHIVSYAR